MRRIRSDPLLPMKRLCVRLSVGDDREPCRTTEPIETPFRCGLEEAQETMYSVWAWIPHGKGHFWKRGNN